MMQAAVWSQPHSSNSYYLTGSGGMMGARRKSSGYQPGTLSDISMSPATDHLSPTTTELDPADIESFVPINGRPVLALGLALIITGSILGLFGIAGLFSNGSERLSIGLGAVSSVLAIAAGVTGSRAGKNFVRNKNLGIQCAIFSVLCFISDIVCIGFCLRIIFRGHDSLLKAIAGAEVFFAAIDLLLSMFCAIITTKLLCVEIPNLPPISSSDDKSDTKISHNIYEAPF